MPGWEDYKSEAKNRGSLAMELFVVSTKPVKSPEELRAVLPAHLAYQKQLEDLGVLVMAGPVSDPTGKLMQGEGMIIYRATSLEEATAITAADPMHAEGIREFSIRKWLVNEGRFDVSLRLSSQSLALA